MANRDSNPRLVDSNNHWPHDHFSQANIMNLFIDTEFTDFSRPDLISIAIVSEDGREFYGERSDFLQVRCTEFVRNTVLPQLGQRPSDIYTLPELKQALRLWLEQFQPAAPVYICSNLDNDWEHFSKLLGTDLPRWIEYRSIEKELNTVRINEYFSVSGLKEHHALNDARATRYAIAAACSSS